MRPLRRVRQTGDDDVPPRQSGLSAQWLTGLHDDLGDTHVSTLRPSGSTTRSRDVSSSPLEQQPLERRHNMHQQLSLALAQHNDPVDLRHTTTQPDRSPGQDGR